ncbi:sensor histidine kinase [Halobellus salinisoli]|uniref:sensor histidine kinase n=1 Tax=Halobellus salinisoli TaxID=3108500 RepID=UPI00300A15A3
MYELVRRDVPFEQKARDVLDLGIRYLEVENGHLTRIDRITNHWEVMVSTDSVGEQFPPGLELDLGTTYCRRTVQSDGQISLSDAPNQGWADDPAFETHGLRCYQGTTLVLRDETYGTVCFVDEDARTEFSTDETMFTELLTRLLERELERVRHETEVTRQINLAGVLNRVLRHNLRNELSIVRGYTQRMADKLPEDTAGDVTIRHVDTLLRLSRKAREVNQVTTTDSDREMREINALVERVVETTAREYPSASATVDYDDTVTAPVLPSFEKAIRELTENAMKHSHDATISVTVECVPNAVEVRIADDGPGLPQSEVEVLESGVETPLNHGSGLGLWLTQWIVTSHEGEVEVWSPDEGTTITLSIPRKRPADLRER